MYSPRTDSRDRLLLFLDTYSLEGYFDESGTHEGSRAVSVAGYVSTAEQWGVFESEWKAELEKYGLEHFHMSEFAQRVGPYRDWPERIRRERFATLVSIINRHSLASVGNVVPKKLFERVMTPREKRLVGGPYGFCAAACFLSVAQLLRDSYPSGRIKYVFELGAPGLGQIQKVFDMNYENESNREWWMMAGISFEGKEVVPLQAADILAYELYKYLPRHLGIESRRPRIEHLTMLKRATLTDWSYLNEDEIRKWSSLLSFAHRPPSPPW